MPTLTEPRETDVIAHTLPVDVRTIDQFVYVICPAVECTRIGGHFGPCSRARGRHRGNR